MNGKKKKRLFKRKKNIGFNQVTAMYSHPIANAGFLFAIYLVMDGVLLNVTKDIEMNRIIFCLFLTFGLFYRYYVKNHQSGRLMDGGKDVSSFVKKRRHAIALFWIFMVLAVVTTLCYDKFIAKWMPGLDRAYYPSQLCFLIWIAPVLDEIMFRYLLYGKWAREKFGTIKGVVGIGILFVICHPVASVGNMILYWLPVPLFYLTYETFGLYGSIFIHILFNFIAL